MFHLIAHLELDGELGIDFAVLAAFLDGTEAQEIETILPHVQLAAGEQLEAGVGNLEMVAFVLLLLDVGKDGGDLGTALVQVGLDGLDLVPYQAAAALVGDDESRALPTRAGSMCS